MITQKNVTVRDTDYMLTQFPATRGLRLLKQIVKLIGPSFAELSKATEGNTEAATALAMEKLFENLDSVDVETLVKDLIASASKGSTAINFDHEFAGDYARMFELVQQIVEFNFGSVFTLVGTSV